MPTSPDPYLILGVTPTASEEELRTAYRRLVQLHHPDHNNGSRESALRFAEVQEAYAHVKLLRKRATAASGTGATTAAGASGTGATSATGATTGDSGLDARLAAMEQELRAAREQREKAARAAAQEAARTAAAAAAQTRAARNRTAQQQTAPKGRAPTDDGQRTADEELGYYTTDDSFTKILDDFADQVATRFAEAHPPSGAHPPTQGARPPRKPRSVADWIDELGSRLTGEQRKKHD